MTDGGEPVRGGPTEIPERLFRQGEDWRHIRSVEAEQRRQARHALRARWPLGRVVRAGLVYGAPVALVLGWYWAGRAIGMIGGN